mgnify:CR=1 FL=1
MEKMEKCVWREMEKRVGEMAVSDTHLTLPTRLRVKVAVARDGEEGK